MQGGCPPSSDVTWVRNNPYGVKPLQLQSLILGMANDNYPNWSLLHLRLTEKHVSKYILLIFMGSEITADGDCSHEIKRCLLLRRKVMTNLDSILKSRDITLTKVPLVKAMVFPVVLYGCESWMDAFELWCWRRLLRVPWTARRSNQSILMEISPGCSLEGLILKLKLQYFGHLMQRADSLEKTLMLGKIEGRRRGDNRGWDGITDSIDMSLGGLWELVMTGRPGMLQFMGSQRVGHGWAIEPNWTEPYM